MIKLQGVYTGPKATPLLPFQGDLIAEIFRIYDACLLLASSSTGTKKTCIVPSLSAAVKES
jgi:hypothetical protein